MAAGYGRCTARFGRSAPWGRRLLAAPFCSRSRAHRLRPPAWRDRGAGGGARPRSLLLLLRQLAGPGLNPAPVSTDWLDEDAGVYTATRVGQSWVAAVDANGGLQDILPINVEPISSISFGPAKPTPPSSGTSPSPPTPTGANVVGGTLTMAATAHDAHGNALSGDVLYSWATSDPSILALMGPRHALRHRHRPVHGRRKGHALRLDSKRAGHDDPDGHRREQRGRRSAMTSVVGIFAARVLPAVACLAAIAGCNNSFSHVSERRRGSPEPAAAHA